MPAEQTEVSTELRQPSQTGGGWLRYFERVTSGGAFLPWVDGLRFIAIAAVLLYHLNGYVLAKASGFTESEARATELFQWCNGANCGVQLFFAISGFILALPFAKEAGNGQPIRLKDYFLRRLTRLEPPFLINLAIATLLLMIVKRESWSDLWTHLLATMTYCHNWVFGEHSRINGVSWSLEIEVQFYVLAPFLLRPYFRTSINKRRTVSILIVTGLVLAKILIPLHGTTELRLGIVYAIDHFLAGILVADLFIHSWQGKPEKLLHWDLLALLVFPLTFWSQRMEFGRALLPVFSCLMLISAMRGPRTNRLISTRGITLVGGMCYTVYLYHFYFLSMLGRRTLAVTNGGDFTQQLAVQILLLVPPVLIACALLFAAFERPFMAWRPFAKRLSN